MKVIVIGGGPAGMIAAIYAARQGSDVVLLEKNAKLGKKLYITGKGRCNITNACDVQELFPNIISNPKFMYSSFYSFSNYDIISFFEELGLKIKTERGDRVFPKSNKSSDVIDALREELKKLNVSVLLNKEVKRLIKDKDQAIGVEVSNSELNKRKAQADMSLGNYTRSINPSTSNKSSNTFITGDIESLYGDKVIIATGGISYPVTGSTGDGYKFAKVMGHDVTKVYPSLVPFNIKEIGVIKELQGLSLKNIEIEIHLKEKELYKEFGELLFTHFGVSGPVILSASSYCTEYLPDNELLLRIDIKPALTYEQLDARVLRDFSDVSNKQFKNSLDKLLPRKLIPVIINRSNIDPEKKVNIITKEERQGLVSVIKGLEFSITSTREYREAIITQGGVDIKDINPSTMESKLVPGTYFAGEVLDIDALTGGYNLQVAWSTGYLAGISAANP